MDPAEPLPFVRQPRSIAMPQARALATVRQRLDREWTTWSSVDAETQTAIVRAREKYADGTTVPFDPAAEAIAALALSGEEDPYDEGLSPLVDLWVHEAGIDGALRALHALGFVKKGWGTIERGPIENGYTLAVRPCRWRRVREHVAAADDREYKLGLVRASAMRQNATFGWKRAIAFAFFPETSWIADALSSLTENITALGLVGTADLATTAKIVKAARGHELGEATFDGRFATLLARFGDDAVPLLRSAIDKDGFVGFPWMAKILATRGSAAVAEALASMLGQDILDVLQPWVSRHPALAVAPLARAMGKSPKAKRLGMPLLAAAIAGAPDVARAITKDAKLKKLVVELGGGEFFFPKKVPQKILDALPPSWTETRAWIGRQAPAAERDVLSHDADEDPDAERHLARLVRAAAHECLPLSIAALDALARRPDPLRAVASIATSTIRAEIGAHASAILARMQQERGLSDDDIADLLVPTYALEGGVLDFGPRQFRIAFGVDFKPQLEGGMRNLPKPNKKDDAVKAAAAVESWAKIKDGFQHEAKEQARRMERAMVYERAFPPEVFLRWIVPHPILGVLARRLLWSSGDRTFRIAEDGTFADIEDRQVPAPDASVRIVHPIALDTKTLAGWGDAFASYEILQPFEQLARARHEDLVIASYVDRIASRSSPFVLESLGWSIDAMYGDVAHVSRELRAATASMVLVGEAERTITGVWAQGVTDRLTASELRREIEKIVIS